MEKLNTKVKIYPDGNFISTSSSRPFFLTREQRIANKLEKEALAEAELEKNALYAASREKLKDSLYGGGEYHREFMESGGFGVALDVIECGSLILEVVEKARKLGIPVNGVVDNSYQRSRLGNLRRAKDRIFDLIYLNDFQFFATFTFNPAKTDSFDVASVMKKVKKWLHNHQLRNNLKYVMVPEHHKSGRIHLHMLYSGDLSLKPSGKWTKQGKPIYNCKSWSYGFSTVIPCDDNKAKLAFYVSKYITKDVKKIFGKYYYSSQGLERECPVEYGNRDYKAIQSDPVHVDAIDIDFKYESSIQFNSTDSNNVEILKELGLEAVEI